MGGKNENKRVPSPESVHIHLTIDKLRFLLNCEGLSMDSKFKKVSCIILMCLEACPM